jgi:hypothetical protein
MKQRMGQFGLDVIRLVNVDVMLVGGPFSSERPKKRD